MSNPSDLPLSGIRVLDFTRYVAGPFCTMVLGDLGADVVKVERPGGDESRNYPPHAGDESTYFLAYNRNKRSLVLDLKDANGRETARALAARADVLAENFTPGTLARLGLGPDTLTAANPHLIHLSISGYGAHSPRPALDPIMQAESGFMAMTGWPDERPYRTGMPMTDIATGMTAAQAVMAALIERERSSRGQRIDIAMWDVSVQMTFHFGIQYLMTGENPPRVGNGSPAAAPLGVYETATGPMQVTGAGDRVFAKLARDVVERPDLLEDARFSTAPARVRNRALVERIFADIFRTRPREEWVARLQAAKVPGGPIRTVREAVRSEEVRERGLVARTHHTALGEVPVLRSPIRVDGRQLPVRAAPVLNEHAQDVRRDWLGQATAGNSTES